MHRDHRPVIPIPSDWMDIPQAAVYMSCTESYVHRITRKREIPFSIVGKRYVLSKRDCDDHLERIRLPATGQSDDHGGRPGVERPHRNDAREEEGSDS